MNIFTIGHSTRSLEEFIGLLNEFHIQALVDIRRYPSSRRFPHFNSKPLRDSLTKAGIEYLWYEQLGGRRHATEDPASPNPGLRNPGFRNYADHMLTEEFRAAVQEIISLGSDRRIAVMCAEKLYFKCHRFLLSDYLHAQGIAVDHIVDPGQLRRHKLTRSASIREDGTVVYPLTDE